MQNKIPSKYILSIILIVPLIVIPHSVDFYTHYKIMFVYVLTGIFIIYYILKLRASKIIYYTNDYMIFLYLVLVILSTAFSEYTYQAIVGATYREEGFAAICCYILIYFTASKFYNFSSKHIKYLFFSSAIIAFYGVIQNFGIDPLSTFTGFHESVTTIGNRNFVGSYLTIVLPVFIFCFSYTKKYRYLILSSLLYLCMLCTYTRSTFVALTAYSILLFYFSIKNNLKYKRLFLFIPIVVILTLGMNVFDQGKTLYRLFSIGNVTSTAIKGDSDKNFKDGGSQRIFIWKRAIKLIPQKPLFGYGPDTFEYPFCNQFGADIQKYIAKDNVYKDSNGNLHISITKFDKAHNEYLQMAVTTGVPSLIFYIAFVSISLYKAIKASKKNLIIIPFICSIVGYLVQAFFNISVVGVAPVYWAFLGIMNNLADKTNETEKAVVTEQSSMLQIE